MKLIINIILTAVIAIPLGILIPQDNARKVYVDSVQVLPDSSSKDTKLVIKGSLPSPAYSLNQISVKIFKDKIDITPLAQFDRFVRTIQVIVPFQDTLAVKVEKKGKYQIRLHGLDGTKTQIIDFSQ